MPDFSAPLPGTRTTGDPNPAADVNLITAAITELRAVAEEGGSSGDARNVKDYGALGDGSTNDSAAIQSAIDAASAAGGGAVFFPRGTYRIGTFVSLKSDVALLGTHRQAVTLKAMTGLTTGVLVATSGNTVSDVLIQELTIDGDYDGSATSTNGVQASAATRVVLNRVIIQNVSNNGAVFQSGSVDCEVINSEIRTTGQGNSQSGFGVLFSNASRCAVRGSRFIDCNGMSIGGNTTALDCQLIGNYLDKSGTPATTANGAQTLPAGTLTVASTAGFPSKGVLDVEGCGVVLYTGKTATTFTGCTGGTGTVANGGDVLHGYEHLGWTAGCTGWIASGNKCMNSRDNGISASGARAVVTGNIVDGALYFGVLLSGSDGVVTGNLIRNIGSAGTGGFAFVGINQASRATVVGNRGFDDRGGSSTSNYAIKEVDPVGFGTYLANNWSGVATSNYLLLSNSNPTIQAYGTATLTYSATITPDATTSVKKKLGVTDTSAFTMNNPANPFPGAVLTFDILNSSGGAMGAITWGAAYKLAGAFTNPATTKRRTISFLYDGTDWVETARAAADI